MAPSLDRTPDTERSRSFMLTAEIRIVLVDRHPLTREAIGDAIDRESGLHVARSTADAAQAVAAVADLHPDVTVVDVGRPRVDGIGTIRKVHGTGGQAIVAVISSDDEEALFEAVEAGASGVVMREAPLNELLEAIRAVARRDAVIPRRHVGALLDRLIGSMSDTRYRRRVSRLTRREKEVLALLATGATNEAIAHDLKISPQTARTHIQNILPKLGVRSRVEAATYVTKHHVEDELEGVGR